LRPGSLLRSVAMAIAIAAILPAVGCNRPNPAAKVPDTSSSAQPASKEAVRVNEPNTTESSTEPVSTSSDESAAGADHSADAPGQLDSSGLTETPSQLDEPGEPDQPGQLDSAGQASTVPPDDTLSQEPNPDDTAAPFRLWLPTTAGPLLVDLEVLIGGQSLSDAFDQQMEILEEEAGGSDGLSWQELTDHIQANPGRYGGVSVGSGDTRNLIRMYDRNRNGQAERDEMTSLLFRDSRVSGPFRLVGTDAYRQVNRTDSSVFQVLDQNADQILDDDEIQSASRSLLQLDRNGDRRINIAELTASSTRMNGRDPWKDQRTSRWGDVAMDLGGFVDWKMVAYAIGDNSRHAIFNDGTNAIEAIDQNRDQSIDSEEAKLLLQVPADLRLTIAFDLARQPSTQVTAIVHHHDVDGTTPPLQDSRQVLVASESLQLVVSVNDQNTTSRAIPPGAFAALDMDGDGVLIESEIPNGFLREYSFAELDSDANGELTLTELQTGMARIQPIWAMQVRARGAEVADALFAWLDRDQDLSLSSREIAASSHRLGQLAAERTAVRAEDLPDTFLLQFGRGEPSQDDTLFSLASRPPRAPRSWPAWAESMDANQDGDIARDEFIGLPAQFDQMDQDHDGFLSMHEVNSFPKANSFIAQ